MIIRIDENNIEAAGYIHSQSWMESHRSFCSPEFVQKHTPQAQTEYLRREMAAGKRLFILNDDHPVGIVSIRGSVIENLYVLPWEQNRGYGTQLLDFAVSQCDGVPTLWILNNNEGAFRLYSRHGFVATGKQNRLNDTLYELELAKTR